MLPKSKANGGAGLRAWLLLLFFIAGCGKGGALDLAGNGDGSNTLPLTCGQRSVDFATLESELVGTFVTINGTTYRITAVIDQTSGGACRIAPHLILNLNF